jgi:hypothetical protein
MLFIYFIVRQTKYRVRTICIIGAMLLSQVCAMAQTDGDKEGGKPKEVIQCDFENADAVLQGKITKVSTKDLKGYTDYLISFSVEKVYKGHGLAKGQSLQLGSMIETGESPFYYYKKGKQLIVFIEKTNRLKRYIIREMGQNDVTPQLHKWLLSMQKTLKQKRHK